LARHQERLAASWPAFFAGTAPDLAEVAGAAIAAKHVAPELVRVAFAVAPRGRAPKVEVTRRPIAPPPSRWRVALAAAARGGTPESRRHKQLDRGWVDALAVAGADETLVWDDDHGLLEGTRSNLFVLVGGRLATPPVDHGLVPGVVRAELLARAKKLGFTAMERSLAAADLAACDALLLTGSGIGVVVVDECDGRPVGSSAGRAQGAARCSRLLSGG